MEKIEELKFEKLSEEQIIDEACKKIDDFISRKGFREGSDHQFTSIDINMYNIVREGFTDDNEKAKFREVADKIRAIYANRGYDVTISPSPGDFREYDFQFRSFEPESKDFNPEKLSEE